MMYSIKPAGDALTFINLFPDLDFIVRSVDESHICKLLALNAFYFVSSIKQVL